MSERRLLHNHPNGDPKPSRDDIEMAKEIAKAAEGTRHLDHDHMVIDARAMRVSGAWAAALALPMRASLG